MIRYIVYVNKILFIMKKIFVDPIIFASGVSLFLYAHNQHLSLGAYLAPLPFWIAIGRPLGLFWNKVSLI